MVKGKRRLLLPSLLALIILAATITLVNAYYIHHSNDLVSKFSPAASYSQSAAVEPLNTAAPDDSAANIRSSESDDSNVAEFNDTVDQR